ncbi:hypothetical protein D915_010476 [Fasciola hepatica]|uniref:Uncharacterized protein n=1 Tax=Fasciola hepatica TaxID=6192 RepID=A0A4E0QTQ4_FASHE|nr:hypothetical protein D915_010476 [Fasciola hepatica]
MIREACNRQRLVANELLSRYGLSSTTAQSESISVPLKPATDSDKYGFASTEELCFGKAPGGVDSTSCLKPLCTLDRINSSICEIEDEFRTIRDELRPVTEETTVVPLVQTDHDKPSGQIYPTSGHYNLGLLSIKLDDDQAVLLVTTLKTKWGSVRLAAQNLTCQTAQLAHQLLILQRLVGVSLTVKKVGSWLEQTYENLELPTLEKRCDQWFFTTPLTPLYGDSGGEDERDEMKLEMGTSGVTTTELGLTFEHRMQFTTELRKLEHAAKQFQDFPLTMNHLKRKIATYVPSRPVLHDVLSFGDDSDDFRLLDISESVEDSLVHTSPDESVKETITKGSVSSNHDEIEDLIITDDTELVSVIPTTDHQPAAVNLESSRPFRTFLTTKAESVTTKSVSTGPTTKIEELPATQSDPSVRASLDSTQARRVSSVVASMVSEVPPSSPMDLHLRLLLSPQLQQVPWALMRCVRDLTLRSQEYWLSCTRARNVVEIIQCIMELLNMTNSFEAWLEQK